MPTTGFSFSQAASSSWQSMQTWKTRRAAMLQDAQVANDSVNSALTDAQSNFWAMRAKLAAQAALKRTQAQIKAKTAAAATTTSTSVNKLA
jgi:hypothetical protein